VKPGNLRMPLKLTTPLTRVNSRQPYGLKRNTGFVRLQFSRYTVDRDSAP
jgi:hypothetical protein